MSRSEKVAEEIRREVGMILQKEVHDPRLGFTTITRVELTPDLRFARIFFSVYGSEGQWKLTQDALGHASGFIRRLLGDRLNLRFVPEIAFKPDHSAEYSIIIEEKLSEINSLQPTVQKETKKSHGSKKITRRSTKKK